MSTNTVTVTTPKGNKYIYYPHPIGTSFKNEGGNYMFAYQQPNGSWTVLYIGQTNDLGVRLANHETLPAAKRKGATHILAHTNNSEQARKAEEAELIGWLKPECNDLLK